MSKTPGRRLSVTKAQARRIWLDAQRLTAAEPFGSGPEATRAAVEHLGYVQIDTINVIERSHHHILWSRIPAYRRDDLRQAQSVDKSVFEYWTHALSYVPVRDLRFFLPLMRQHRRDGHKWLTTVTSADMRKVMRLIRKAGGLTIRDIVCYMDAPSKPATRRLIEQKVRRNELIPIALEGAGKIEHWARPKAIEASGPAPELVHVLSPFDPLIIQRKRTHLFFDYEHRFEA